MSRLLDSHKRCPMSISTLIDQVKSITADVAAGNFASAIKTAGAFVSSLGDIAASLGFRGTADGATDKALLVAALQDCEAECAKVGAFEGKIFPGDGSFLKMLVQLFLKFAPLILDKKPE